MTQYYFPFTMFVCAVLFGLTMAATTTKNVTVRVLSVILGVLILAVWVIISILTFFPI